MTVNNHELQEMYSKNKVARRIFDTLLGEYERNRSVLSSRHLAWRTDQDEGDIKKAYRDFERLGLGRYVEGRWGHLCRFEWAMPMREVAKVAAGKADQLLEPTTTVESNGVPAGNGDNGDSGNSENGGGLRHSYNLRPDFAVSLRLPCDFSQSEAGRLADFIRTLPFPQAEKL